MKLFKSGKFQLQYSTWGDPKGQPSLFFHGFPGSHVQAEAIAPLVKKYNLYLIACDRPGYGASTGEGSAEEFLQAVRALLNQLSVKQFTVLGVSGGSPWAHLMASKFPDDTIALGIICGLCPYTNEAKSHFSRFQWNGLFVSRLLPSKLTKSVLQLIMKRVNPESGLKHLSKLLNLADQKILTDPANKNIITHSMQQARAQGAEGILFDLKLFSKDWLKNCDKKRLAEIPTIYFHGKEDNILDYEMSAWMHEKNPKSKLKYFDAHGHYSLPIEAADQILTELQILQT